MDALPITAASGKANKAKRYEEIMVIFDKLRVKLYNDAQDIERVLAAHADEGAVEDNAPQPLPEGEIEEPEAEVEEDDDF